MIVNADDIRRKDGVREMKKNRDADALWDALRQASFAKVERAIRSAAAVSDIDYSPWLSSGNCGTAGATASWEWRGAGKRMGRGEERRGEAGE